MEYGRFVRLRRPVWDRFEAHLQEAERGAKLTFRQVEDLALEYRQVLHDHALAGSRFPGTSVAWRLGALAIRGNRWLQRGARDDAPRGSFWRDRFPAAFRRHLPLLGLTTVLFLGAVGLGWVTQAVRPGLAWAVLGPEALEGLAEGRLWTESLVTTTPPSIASSAIATNNLSVALTAFAGGALAGLGALWVVLLNGFFLGAVFGITFQYSMGRELAEFVSVHGPLELTLILVCAAAGLGIGRALVAADDRPRGEVLTAAGRSALTVLLGSLPWFVVLGIVEAWISPSPAVPAVTKPWLGVGLLVVYLAQGLLPPRRRATSDGSGVDFGGAR